MVCNGNRGYVSEEHDEECDRFDIKKMELENGDKHVDWSVQASVSISRKSQG